MEVRRIGCIATLAILVGCSSGPTSEESNDRTPSPAPVGTVREGEDASPPDVSTPEGSLLQSFTDGYAHLNSALDLLETARRAGRDALESHTGTGEGREAWLSYLDAIDSVGSQLTDLGSVPTEEELKTDFTAADERRLKAIEEINIARFELNEATANANAILGRESEGLFSDAWSAAERLERAIEAFGGKIQNPG